MPNAQERLISQSENPALYELVAAFSMLRGYVEFRYRKLPECRKKLTPSAAAAQNSTVMPENPADWDKVSGFLTETALGLTKDGNFTLTLRNQKRKNAGDIVDEVNGEVIAESYYSDKSNAQEDGTTKIGFDKGEYLYRSYRLDVRGDGYGVDLSTVQINIGGKRRMFPNVRALAE